MDAASVSMCPASEINASAHHFERAEAHALAAFRLTRGCSFRPLRTPRTNALPHEERRVTQLCA